MEKCHLAKLKFIHIFVTCLICSRELSRKVKATDLAYFTCESNSNINVLLIYVCSNVRNFP